VVDGARHAFRGKKQLKLLLNTVSAWMVSNNPFAGASSASANTSEKQQKKQKKRKEEARETPVTSVSISSTGTNTAITLSAPPAAAASASTNASDDGENAISSWFVAQPLAADAHLAFGTNHNPYSNTAGCAYSLSFS
jgi:hypothetical protein